MNTADIKKLIGRYYEGETSLSEERILREYLQRYEGTDDDILRVKNIFEAFVSESSKTFNVSFEDVIGRSKKRKMIRLYAIASSVAAVLIVSLIIVNVFRTEHVVYAYINGQPVYDKQEAIEYSQQAFALVSNNLEKGTKSFDLLNRINTPAELLIEKNSYNE